MKHMKEGKVISTTTNALEQSGTMPPKRECRTESPLHGLCSEWRLHHHLSPGWQLESSPLLSHTTHLPWNQQERTTPQSMALSLVLAGKSYQVWKPGVLLRGRKKRNLSAIRKKHHIRTQSHHSGRYSTWEKSGGMDSIRLSRIMGQPRSWSEESD